MFEGPCPQCGNPLSFQTSYFEWGDYVPKPINGVLFCSLECCKEKLVEIRRVSSEPAKLA